MKLPPPAAARSALHCQSNCRSVPLSAVADVNDVAVFDDVLFAREHQLAGFLELHFGSMAGRAGRD